MHQNSLRPVLLQYFKRTIYHIVKAVTYRRVLAEYGHDFESLRQFWTARKLEGLEQVITKIIELKDEDRTELNLAQETADILRGDFQNTVEHRHF